MAKKYNTKKSTLLGRYLKTDFEKSTKSKKTYRNTDSNWLEKDAAKIKYFKNIDLLEQSFLGDKRRVKLSLINGDNYADINTTDSNGNNALILAVYSGREEVVKYLTNYHKDEHGEILDGIEPIDLNHLNNDGISALHLAVKLNNTLIVKILLNAGADANMVGAYNETPIFEAVKQDNNEMIDLLCEYAPTNRANVDIANREGRTPLMIACQNRNRQEAMLSLLKHDAEIVCKDERGRTPLMHAANNDNGAMMDILLKKSDYSKEYMNMCDINQTNTLMICARRGNREAVRVLLARGANPFWKDKKHRTAADCAMICNNHTCQEIILKAIKIYNETKEKFGEDLSEKQQKEKTAYLEKQLMAIGKQNRVNNSCIK